MNLERLQRLLRERFEESRSRNPNYRLRAFARDVGLSPGALSELLSGKRRLTAKRALNVVDSLKCDPQERAEIFGASEFASETPMSFLRLQADVFSMVADSLHFALISLLRIEGIERLDAGELARRMRRSRKDVEIALERLVHLGFVTPVPDGQGYRCAEEHARTSDGVPSAAIRRAHAEGLERAREALLGLPVESRDFSSVTLPCAPARLAEIRERIRAFQDSLIREFETTASTAEVFRLQMQMFPLSHSSTEGATT